MNSEFDYFETLRMMLTIRRTEERLEELHRDGVMRGSAHLSIGQEAIPVGVASALRPDDATIATYRGHGWALARGADLHAFIAEMLAKKTGLNQGRGGSAYFSAPAVRFLGENSIVGAGGPIGCGVAYAAQRRGSDMICTVTVGDGAMNQGGLLEAFNFAAAYKLGVLFICENNQWSELTPIASTVGNPRLHERAAAFGMRATEVDGNDPKAVHDTAAELIAGLRAGDGPAFLEAHTARLRGHYVGDMDVVRSAEIKSKARDGDPIPRLIAQIDDAERVDAIGREVEQAVEAAIAQAISDPIADENEVFTHVHAY